MKTFLLSLFLISSSTLAFACEEGEVAFIESQQCAKVEWINGPNFNQFNSLSVTLANESELKLNVIPWMVMDGGHEHGSRPVTIISNSNRDYIVEKIYFMSGMMGNWYLRFQLLNDKKEIIEEVRSLVRID
jgi:hypothetical protein